MNEEDAIRIEKIYSSVVNFAMQQNHVPVICRMILQNNTDTDLHDLKIIITAQPNTVSLEPIALILSASYLVNVTERISGLFTI